jgi:hypothetical protein
VFLAFMRDLKTVKFFKNVRVLLISDDIPVRHFPFWASRIVEPIPGLTPYYVDDTAFQEDTIPKTVKLMNLKKFKADFTHFNTDC